MDYFNANGMRKVGEKFTDIYGDKITVVEGNGNCDGCAYFIRDDAPRLCEDRFLELEFCMKHNRPDKKNIKFAKHGRN